MNMRINTGRFASSCLVMLSVSVAAHGDNWPQWRGPIGNGTSSETHLPAKWSASENVLWTLPMPGMSAATPAVWKDRIFVCSDDGADIALLCISTAGKELWKKRISETGRKMRMDEASNSSPSPSTDGQHVYVFTGTGVLACFDFDGKEIWRVDVQERYGKFQIYWGMHVTPLLHGDRLYLTLLHAGGHWVVALDKATGKEVWKVKRSTDARAECTQSYASPCLGTDGKEAYLIVQGCDYATGHRLSDGQEIWRLGDLNPKAGYNQSFRFVASPASTPEVIIVPTAKNGPVVAIRPDAHGTIGTGTPYEKWRRPHNTSDVPSPVVHDGLVYLCRENGVLICMDAQTGRELYTERLHPARYRSSPEVADGKLYCTARDGWTTVIRTGPKFEVLAVNQLPDQIAASPAISDGRIYLRGFKNLYAIGQGAEQTRR